MIESIHIKNYKSVVNLGLELGQFNVLIGENGCGKSNILEGIALGAAASNRLLHNEFFSSRGIRNVDSQLMFSCFENNDDSIFISFNKNISESVYFELKYDTVNDTWHDISKSELNSELTKIFDLAINTPKTQLSKIKKGLDKHEQNILSKIRSFTEDDDIKINKDEFSKILTSALDFYLNSRYENDEIQNFLIYSPENSSLRLFQGESQIKPLGIGGEGLFHQLKNIFSSKSNKGQQKDIIDTLSLLDWFSSISIPKDLLSNEYKINIQDRYINSKIREFDQRSANEGFLFLLFYSVLFTSSNTPDFFAIDNIENSFNPKLCTEIIRRLIVLSKKYGKQVILTTHNPAILEGLDLMDEEQRLFVIRRNGDGHTIANRIERKKGSKINLSEAWRKGFIGGLPENF